MADTEKQTLIYVPGIDGTGRLLYRQKELFETYRVLCESYPQDRATTYEELAGTAIRRLEHAAAGRPAVVLAESFGGAIALMMALERPDLIERMVLVNTFARFSPRILVGIGARLAKFSPFKTVPVATRWFRKRFFLARDVPLDDQDELWRLTRDVSIKAYSYRLALIARLDLRPRLPEIAIPTLVLVAPNDRVVPPRAGRELARMLPNASLIERPVGHGALLHPNINIRDLIDDPANWGS